MSMPHGAPHPVPQQPTPPGGKVGGPDLPFILTCVAGGTGVLGYLLGFLGPEASVLIGGLPGFSLVAAAVLVGMRLLPKTPSTTYAAAPLAVYATLGLLQGVVSGGAGGLVVVLLLLAVVQLVAVGAVLLSEAGVVVLPALRSKSASASSASGPFPRPDQPQPGQFGQPVQRPVPAPPQPPWGHNHTGPQPPVGWNLPSGGQPPGQTGQSGQSGPQNQPGPQAQVQGQASQQDQQEAVQRPQGTQQMPHPAAYSEQQRKF